MTSSTKMTSKIILNSNSRLDKYSSKKRLIKIYQQQQYQQEFVSAANYHISLAAAATATTTVDTESCINRVNKTKSSSSSRKSKMIKRIAMNNSNNQLTTMMASFFQRKLLKTKSHRIQESITTGMVPTATTMYQNCCSYSGLVNNNTCGSVETSSSVCSSCPQCVTKCDQNTSESWMLNSTNFLSSTPNWSHESEPKQVKRKRKHRIMPRTSSSLDLLEAENAKKLKLTKMRVNKKKKIRLDSNSQQQQQPSYNQTTDLKKAASRWMNSMFVTDLGMRCKSEANGCNFTNYGDFLVWYV